MQREMVVSNEGFMLDDAGNMISTIYIDSREERERTAIPALVKGCKREYALEDGETILLSSPARFREHGGKLIKDGNEGFAEVKSTTEMEETAAQARKRRTVDDLNEALELTNSRIRMARKESFRHTSTERKSLSFGKDWWIFSTSIEPNEEEWDSWRAALPEEYSHVSRIGQPGMFAQALARMVIEKIGPQGKDGWLNHSVSGQEVGRTKHAVQQVIHGPVIYTDDVYDFISETGYDLSRIAAQIFTKSEKHAAQREYRFAVLNGGDDHESLLLPISGMMRDSLNRTERGLIRAAPSWSAVGENEDSELPANSRATPKLDSRESIETDQISTRISRRWETRTPEGQVISSEGEQQESVSEKSVTHRYGKNGEDVSPTKWLEQVDEATAQESTGHLLEQPRGEQGNDLSEEEIVQEIAFEECDWDGGSQLEEHWTVPVRTGTGRVYKSFQEASKDPACPVSPAGRMWQEEMNNPEELAKIYGYFHLLAHKVCDIEEESRQEAESAGWHAIHCIRNIYACFGDIVDSIWFERERFVVLRLKVSGELGATGRIVTSPSGSYAYCIQLPNREILGHGADQLGTRFFPMGTQIEDFETFGWPAKEGNSEAPFRSANDS